MPLDRKTALYVFKRLYRFLFVCSVIIIIRLEGNYICIVKNNLKKSQLIW